MNEKLEHQNIHSLLWSMTIPAILGMLSSAVFNVVDRIFVGRIHPLALSGVGITMPVQILQMSIVLLIGIGTSALISLRLGEDKKKEAEDLLFLSFKYIILSMFFFAFLFSLFSDALMRLLSVSDEVMVYAKPYISIIIWGGIIGIPGYCLNNSLRSIGKADITMKIILATSILNILLDPFFIFVLDMGIAGAAVATVISQTVLTIYITLYFIRTKDLMIHLRFQKVEQEMRLLRSILVLGAPSFYVQILATALQLFVNHNVTRYGSDFDVAALTILSTVFSFYHMIIYGLVQGSQPICGYNYGKKRYDRVLLTLRYSLGYASLISVLSFLLIQLYPSVIVGLFTDDSALIATAAAGMRIYLMMIPLIGTQTIASQYFQSVDRPSVSSFLSLLRYGIIMIPCTLLLAPHLGVRGIYLSNAISDFIASSIAILFIIAEINRLKNAAL